MASEPAKPYQVVYQQAIVQQLRLWGKRATELGLRKEFLDTLRVVLGRLTTAPREWGEPRYSLHALGMEMFQGAYGLLHFTYGVNEAKRLVFIQLVRPLPGFPVEGES